MDAVTTAELPPVQPAPLWGEVTIAVAGTDATWHLSTSAETGDGVTGVLTVHGEGELEIRLAAPLADAAGFWHPGCHWERTLVADWAGTAATSLVHGTVAGCLFDAPGTARLAFAATDHVPQCAMRYGVSEENKTFVVHITLTAGPEPYQLLLVDSAPSVATAMRRLRASLARRITPLPLPAEARTPAYSTWYAFNQDVSAAPVEREAELAAELGCGILLLDDGWQELGSGRGYAGVGDWVPDRAKFPDLAAHVRTVRNLGMKYVLWVAPLLLGPRSRAFEDLARFAPVAARAPGAQVLDPRLPPVRRHVRDLAVRLVADYGLDGLKLDFLDDVMLCKDAPVPEDADTPDLGVAMARLLTGLRDGLEEIRPGVLIELRQPYEGPGLAAFGNLLRADDCPADAVDNRIRTVDMSFLSLGALIHSDMLMWDPNASPATAARQFIAVLQAVPQLSTRLADLPAEHARMLRFWLAQWRRLNPVLTRGELEPGRPDTLYEIISATSDDNAVVIAHGRRLVPLPQAPTVTVVNATTEPRVVVEVTGTARNIEESVFDTCGTPVARHRRVLGPGLTALAVPESGMAVLREVSP
ncbi:glycoside hydrolase family 36 protein [Streptomyces sp. NPDC057496]|uniref:glycoside hydrolase family 36 protein n=1 Tax=Streptomyces sp. NPDC057496 TaxID=3346149 RepID=UPI0036B7C99B